MTVNPVMRSRLETQGFCGLDDATLEEVGPWLRWAPSLCTLCMAAGVLRRFACGIATVWLVVTGWAFHSGALALGYALGIPLILVAALVSITHICIPSLIYNALFRRGGVANG